MACLTVAINGCYDEVVYLILRSILKATATPEEVQAQLKPSKASPVVNYICEERTVKMRAETKIQTDLLYNTIDPI